MNTLSLSALRRLSSCALLALAPAALPSLAQTTAVAPNQPEIRDDEVVELSRFIVTEGEDQGYRATSTLAGTRVKTDLRDIGSALSIVTNQFLEDTGARDSQELLVYTVGTEVGGVAGNFTGAGNDVVLSERDTIAVPHTVTRVRGLAVADNTRDLFLTDIPWDAYYVDRMELQRGPNSILFGLGKPGGVINASLKQAMFRNANRVETRFGRHGSIRGALDLNRVLLKDELAVRFNALKDRTYYQQDPAFKDDERVFAALRYDPAFLKRGSARTTLRINYEHGAIESNNPRSMPPMDRLTPWFETGTTTVDGREFSNLNQFIGDFRYRNAYFASVPGSGFNVRTSPGYQAGAADTNHGNYVFFGDTATGLPTAPYYVPQVAFTEARGLGPGGAIDGNVRGLFGTARLNMVETTSAIARRLQVPFAFAYKNKSITDPSIFDFYNKTLDGPNKDERQDFDALNVTLSQTFWNGRAGIEAVFDRQEYQQSNEALYYGLGTGDATITVDINALLPDLTPNPNAGRPMIVNRSYNGGGGKETERNVFNLTGYLELRADDFLEESWLARLLGRQVFTGAMNKNQYDVTSQLWASGALASHPFDIAANRALLIRREFSLISYLGPDMRGHASPAGLVSNIEGRLALPANGLVFFDSTWNQPTNPADAGYVNPGAAWVNPFNNQTLTQSENPANYVGWQSAQVGTLSLANGDRDLLTYASDRRRDKISSSFFVWQGFLWDGLIVPTFGYRRDTAKAYSVLAPVTPDGFVDLTADSYRLPGTPDSKVSGTTKSYSLVVHTPQFIRKQLPLGMDVSLLYNKSSNFEPSAGRVDVVGRPVGNPSGRTEDYGIVVSFLDERFRLKVNKYKTSAENATYLPQSPFYLMQIENLSWIRAKRFEAGLSGNPAYEGQEYNYGANIDGVFTQTEADRSRQQQDVAAVLSNFAPEIWDAWGVPANDTRWQDNLTTSPALPTNFVGTTDSVSEGYEYEFNLRPVDNWNIAINASKMKAVRSNIGGDVLNAWVEARNAVWNGPAGNLLVSGTGSQTHSDLWNQNFYSNYQLGQLLDGSSAPEIRAWRFNVITNYRFTTGALKNFSVGGAYRWEDKVVLGYPSVLTTINGQELESFDITRPFWGPTSDTVDLWAGHTRKLTDKIDWRIQLNVRNAFGKNEIVPINAQPDGGPAAFRIRNGPNWTITNTFEF